MIVALIGHGKTPLGKGWGPKIDACNLVVRMWNWAPWQDVEDYGSRYDYGFFEISSTEMARFFRHVERTPTRGWIATELRANRGHKHFLGELPARTRVVDSKVWENVAYALGGSGDHKPLALTRGVRAACWAIQYLSRFRGEQQLVLVGFDNVYAGTGLTIAEGFHPTYVDCPAGFPFRDYTGGKTKYRSHDYAVEGPLLAKLAEEHGVKIVHAQEVW